MRPCPPPFVVAFIAGALASCSPAADPPSEGGAPGVAEVVQDTAADRAAVEGVARAFLDAFNAADRQAIASVFAPDVVQMPPDGPVLEGREATVQANMDFIAQFDTPPVQTATVDEVMLFGDHAAARGTWTVRTTSESGDEQVVNGKWFQLLERGPDGGWLGSRWIWNQETPPPM